MQCFSIPNFKVSDKVFMKAQFFRTTWPLKKLSKKYLGPYKIIFHPGILLFTLCLSESIHSVHLVFYVSMLESAIYNTFPRKTHPVSVLVIIDEKLKYEISWIVNSKINHQQICKLLYKVIWLEYENIKDKFEWITVMRCFGH